MKERTIEILLLFGIVFVSLAIVILLGRQYAAHLEKEGFQGVAKGGAAPRDRDVYDRPRHVKEKMLQNQYAQERYKQPKERVTNPPIKFIRIEGKNEYLQISQIAAFDLNGTNVALQATATASSVWEGCHHHHHHGRDWRWRDEWGCHTSNPWNAITGEYRTRWWDENIFISHPSNAWFELSLRNETDINNIQIWNRADSTQERLDGFTMSLLSASRQVVYQFRLNGNHHQQHTIPAFTCRSGYRKLGDTYGTTCLQNCAAGETADNEAGMCYKPCKSGDYLEGGTGGTCKTACPAGFTLAGHVCYKDCVSPNIELDVANCYKPCQAGEDASRLPKCYKPCETTAGAGAAYRLIEDKCFPNDPYTYLPIAWMGPVISQADTVENIGLCLPLGQKNGDRVGIWGPVPNSSSDTSWDVVWAYTENMELINMNNRKCLDTAFLTKTPTTWECHGDIQQKWFIDSEGRIRSKQYPDRCLTTDTANGYNTTPVEAGGDPKVRLTKARAIDLQPCTNDGSRFQRWKIPAARVGLNQAVGSAAAPPALPSEPLNRDGFIGTQAEPLNRDGFTDGGSGSKSSSVARSSVARSSLAKRTTDDAF